LRAIEIEMEFLGVPLALREFYGSEQSGSDENSFAPRAIA
jgi:hypothetical protein